MTLNEFKALNEEQQAKKAWDGVFLELRTSGNQSILLFNLDSYYAELYYEHNPNEIVSVRSFKSTNALEPYLDLIKIDEIDGLLK